MSDVNKRVVEVTTLKLVLSPTEISRILREHIYGRFGVEDDRTFDREPHHVDLCGWEPENLTATIQITRDSEER